MRIITIEHLAEVHVHEDQLVVEQEAGTASVPLEQVELLVTYGPSIRISTMAQAMLARALVTTGFVPALGIHHHSQFNAFNLTDDLIEPFRPCVDMIAPGIVSPSAKLGAQQRHALRNVLFMRVDMGSRKVTVSQTAEEVVDSLARTMRDKDPGELRLPRVIAPEYDLDIRD